MKQLTNSQHACVLVFVPLVDILNISCDCQSVADPELWFRGGDMASAGARAYNGGLGAEPPAGSRGRAPGQGGEAPLKLTSFFHWNVQRRSYSRHFSRSVGGCGR